MNIDGKHYRTIWPHTDGASVNVIDQTLLPNGFATMRRANLSDEAIRSMVVRGAPTPCCLCFAYSESRTPSLQLKLDD